MGEPLSAENFVLNVNSAQIFRRNCNPFGWKKKHRKKTFRFYNILHENKFSFHFSCQPVAHTFNFGNKMLGSGRVDRNLNIFHPKLFLPKCITSVFYSFFSPQFNCFDGNFQ